MLPFRRLLTISLPAAIAFTVPLSSPVIPGLSRSSPDSALLASYRWRNIGPDRGGRSIAATGVKGRPREAYFGATGGGLWKTTDGGETWAAVTDGQIKSASVGAVAVSETHPDIVYIGMGETCIRGNIMPGDGVYKSSDAGKTWTHIGFSESHGISKIRIHPTNPEIVYVAAFGKYSAPNPERALASIVTAVGLATLAAYLNPDLEVTLQDEHVEPLKLDDHPDLVVIKVYITNAYSAYRIADHYRARGAYLW